MIQPRNSRFFYDGFFLVNFKHKAKLNQRKYKKNELYQACFLKIYIKIG